MTTRRVCKECETRPPYDPHSDYCQECADGIDRMVRGWWEDDVADGLLDEHSGDSEETG